MVFMGVNVKSYLGVGIDILSYIKEHQLDEKGFIEIINEKVIETYLNDEDLVMLFNSDGFVVKDEFKKLIQEKSTVKPKSKQSILKAL